MGCQKITLLFLLIVGFSSCYRVSIDENAPNVYIDAPFEGAVYRVGDTMTVDFRVIDDVELSEVKFRMHDNQQTHSEEAPSNIFLWDTLMVLNAFGTESDFKLQWTIPTYLTGSIPFHFVLEATDDSGNTSPTQEINFEVMNDFDLNAPKINLTTTDISIFSGNTFVILGNAEDQEALSSITYLLKDLEGNIEYEANYNIDGTTYDITEFIQSPSIEAEYLLEVMVMDIGGNETADTVMVKVL